MPGTDIRRIVAPLLFLLTAGLIAGCGGGGGGGDIPVAGVVYQSRLAGTAVANATVNAYVWPDLTTQVTTSAPTGSEGRYSLKLPASTAGKDVILVATTPTRLRASILVAALPAIGRSNADIDIATTLAAELTAKSGKDQGVSQFSDSSVQTIASRFRDWEYTANLQPVAGGTELLDQFGNGLKPGSPSSNYAATDPVIKNALTHLQETAGAQTLAAKRIVRWLRDTALGLFNDGHNEKNALREALDEQRQVINDEVRVSSELGQRLGTVITALFEGQEVFDGGSWVTMPPLKGQAPGAYTWKQNAYGRKYLDYAGPAADGKSWVVTSEVADASLDDRITITPANKLDTFGFTPAAGSYTIRVIKTTETDANRTLDWAITLTFTGPATAPTAFAVNLSVKDPGLTGPITLSGNVSGVVVAPASDPNHAATYSQLSLTGNISAPFFVGSIGNLTVQWYESTAKAANLNSISISDVSFHDNPSKSITGSLSSASITFDSVASFSPSPKFALPNDMKISGSQITFSDHTLKINSGEVKFKNTVNQDGTVVMNPTKLDADISFSSSAFALAGTVTSAWTSLPTSLNQTHPTPVSSYPVGSVTIKGQLQPSSGLLGTLDSTLVFATSSTAATATFTINSLGYEGETLSGKIVSSTPVVAGNLDKPTTVTVDLNETPNSLKVHLASDTSGAITGWIASESGGAHLADIGKAGDLGLSELGANTVIIKYSDGTFETAASILPN